MAERLGYFRYPLSRILGTDARLRVLRELAEHGGLLTATDLIQRTRLAPQSVRNALALLEECGVVERFGGARGASVQLAKDHPLIPSLVALFDAERARVLRVHSAIQAVSESLERAPTAVWVYGSVGRGEDDVNSDFDLLVVTADNVDPDETADAFREGLRSIGHDQRVHFAVQGLTESQILELVEKDHPFWRDLGTGITLKGPVPEALHAWLRRPRHPKRVGRRG